MGFYRVDGYAQLFGNFIDGQSIYAQPDDLTLFGRQIKLLSLIKAILFKREPIRN